MAFKLKGKSIVQGTSGHKAALKQREDRRKFELENLKREEAADKARKDEIKKSKTSDDLNDYLKKMEELLDKGISPKEAEQMLAENSKPLKQKKQKGKPTTNEKNSKNKKGKIVYKDGKKYYQASDGTLHTGQVEDYERELEIDKANKPLKMKSPAKQVMEQPRKRYPIERNVRKREEIKPILQPYKTMKDPVQRKFEPMRVGRYPDAYIPPVEIKNREPEAFVRPEFDGYGWKMNPKKKTKVGKFLSKITKKKKKK